MEFLNSSVTTAILIAPWGGRNDKNSGPSARVRCSVLLIYSFKHSTGSHFLLRAGCNLTSKPFLSVSFFIPKNMNVTVPSTLNIILSLCKIRSEGLHIMHKTINVIHFCLSCFNVKLLFSPHRSNMSTNGLTVITGVLPLGL